ncbi:MAG: hypothetical protein H7Y20_11545 [Bryobacteraceae bacterium]|nr:hypothetical protein [Bryobacteraceae bacterium]
MGQALHIFGKDVDYLRREILLIGALAAVMVFVLTRAPQKAVEPLWIEAIIVIAASNLIARVIHGEPIPGDRQFWITRPYRWKSLLASRLLFILGFVHAPVCAAHLICLFAGGFPLLHNLPGLLWSQILLFIWISLPVSALATLTSGTVPFLFSTLVVIGVGVGIQQLPAIEPGLGQWPGPIAWVRYAITGSALAGLAAVVVVLQYRRRMTQTNRVLAATAACFLLALYLCLPWRFGFAVQSGISAPFPGAEALKISLATPDPRVIRRFRPGLLSIDFPLSVSGLPEAADLRADAITISIHAPGGRSWSASAYEDAGFSVLRKADSDDRIIRNSVLMDREFLRRERDHPITLRGSIYLTIFGKPRTATLPRSNSPINVMDGLQCYTGANNDVFCRTLFRWPDRLIAAKSGDGATNTFTRLLSYSPIPASINIAPIETRWASTEIPRPEQPNDAREVTIVSKEPLAHFRRDFEILNVDLRQYAPADPEIPVRH